MSLKKWLTIWLAIFIITPIVCNFIVLTPHHASYNVALSPKDWLSFFGGYVGCVISAIISFIILWYNRTDTLKLHKLQLDNNYKRENVTRLHSEIVDVQKELASRFAQFDLSVMMNLSTTCKGKPSSLKDDLPILQKMYEKYLSLKNSAELLYEKDTKDGCESFYQNYNILMSKVIVLLHNYILYVIKISKEEKMTPEIEISLITFSQQAEECIKENQMVLNLAKGYVLRLINHYEQEENNILNEIQNYKL